ncbi:multidrug effflux MFS transporter [Pustulibacterium marinum]
MQSTTKSKSIVSTENHTVILLVLGTLIALGPFSIDMYLQAFQSIADDFHTTKHAVELSLTSYFIGISLGQLLYGPVMDKYGRRVPQLIGLVIYIVAAVGCYFSPNLISLIVARFFLALGASAGMVSSKAIVRDIFGNSMEVARAMSFLMLIMGGAPIVAPWVGGIVVNHFSWETIFLFLIIFAIIMLVNVYLFLPESSQPNPKISLGLGSVSRKYFDIFRHPEFFTFSVAGGLTIGAMFAYISDAAVLFQDVYHIEDFGYLVGINAAGLIAGTQLNRFVIKRISVLDLSVRISFILIGVSLLLLINTLTINNFYVTFITLFFMMLFLGFQNPNCTTLSLNAFSKRAGRASALVGSIKMISGALVSFIISSLQLKSAVPLAAICFVLYIISALLFVRYNKKVKNYKSGL